MEVATMADRELLNYLELAYELESERYTLDQIVSTLRDRKTALQNQITSEERKYTHSKEYEKSQSHVADKVMFVFAGLCGLGVIDCALHGSAYGGLYIIFTIICIAVGCNIKSGKDKVVEKEDRLAAEDRKRATTARQNNAKINEECKQLDKMISEFSTMLTKKQSSLIKLYSYDVLHRNYRNLYGVSKIYNLLDTGICNKLTGVDGAYSQMRTDQIIDNQKISICLQSELIRTNRLMLTSIDDTNNILRGINNTLYENNQSTGRALTDIRNSVAINNFLTRSIIDDTKVINKSASYLAMAERQRRLEQGYLY
jgi:hypothetical protein